jgi:hypothetical protein
VTLNRRSVWLLEQSLAHPALTRSRAAPAARAMLWTRYVPGRYGKVVTTPCSPGQVMEWVARGHPALTEAGVTPVAEDSGPLPVGRRRIRTTFTSRARCDRCQVLSIRCCMFRP